MYMYMYVLLYLCTVLYSGHDVTHSCPPFGLFYFVPLADQVCLERSPLHTVRCQRVPGKLPWITFWACPQSPYVRARMLCVIACVLLWISCPTFQNVPSGCVHTSTCQECIRESMQLHTVVWRPCF